jgi:hypothetical protein
VLVGYSPGRLPGQKCWNSTGKQHDSPTEDESAVRNDLCVTLQANQHGLAQEVNYLKRSVSESTNSSTNEKLASEMAGYRMEVQCMHCENAKRHSPESFSSCGHHTDDSSASGGGDEDRGGSGSTSNGTGACPQTAGC